METTEKIAKRKKRRASIFSHKGFGKNIIVERDYTGVLAGKHTSSLEAPNLSENNPELWNHYLDALLAEMSQDDNIFDLSWRMNEIEHITELIRKMTESSISRDEDFRQRGIIERIPQFSSYPTCHSTIAIIYRHDGFTALGNPQPTRCEGVGRNVFSRQDRAVLTLEKCGRDYEWKVAQLDLLADLVMQRIADLAWESLGVLRYYGIPLEEGAKMEYSPERTFLFDLYWEYEKAEKEEGGNVLGFEAFYNSVYDFRKRLFNSIEIEKKNFVNAARAEMHSQFTARVEKNIDTLIASPDDEESAAHIEHYMKWVYNELWDWVLTQNWSYLSRLEHLIPENEKILFNMLGWEELKKKFSSAQPETGDWDWAR